MLYYFKENLEQLLLSKQVELASAILTAIIFVITCQDIAVDAWAIESLHPENAEYGSSTQSIGHRVGFFFSGTIFISLNDPDFCQKWFGYGEPIWTLESFLSFYCIFTLLITLYVAFFVPERDAALKKSYR